MNETIGKNIRLLREYNNMSQQELADKLYITRQSISKWESGLVAPDLEKLLKMSELFNVKIDDLLNDNFIINKNKLSKVMLILTFILLFLLTFSYLGIVYYLDVN